MTAFDDAVVGGGVFACGVDAPLFLVGVAADGGLDGAGVLFDDAFDEGDVEFFDLFAHEGAGQGAVCGGCFGYYDETGGVLI